MNQRAVKMPSLKYTLMNFSSEMGSEYHCNEHGNHPLQSHVIGIL